MPRRNLVPWFIEPRLVSMNLAGGLGTVNTLEPLDTSCGLLAVKYDHRMATTSTVGAEERRDRLREILQRDGRIVIETAAIELKVSSMTVRRDLADLEADGNLRRVRGGAVPSLRPRPFSERLLQNAPAKEIIAAKAQNLIPETGAVAFDASSTAGVTLARFEHRSSEELLLATNSYDNFVTASRTQGPVTLLIGGQTEPRTNSFVGHLACQAAQSLHYTRFFTSAAAVDTVGGTSEVSLPEAQVKATFAAAADETVLLADHEKLGQLALARALRWSQIALLITDLDPSDPLLAPYRGLVAIL